MDSTVVILIIALALMFLYVATRKPAPVNSSTSNWLAQLVPIAAAGVAAYKASDEN
jgi:hypothetical protein